MKPNHIKTALVTGTTNGIGQAMSHLLLQEGWHVIGIDRRDTDDKLKGSANFSRITCNIVDKNAVVAAFQSLVYEKRIPSLYFLNAGVNEPDFEFFFSFDAFRRVFETNLYGVLTFIESIQQHTKNATVVGISSTSNLVPNPGHLGYFASKKILHDVFKIFRREDFSRHYLDVVLGPVKTGIASRYGGPVGLQKVVFDALCVSAEEAARIIYAATLKRKDTLYYPLRSLFFYLFMKCSLHFFPNLYHGSRLRSAPILEEK